MQDFGKFTARNDPFLHFYETFLAEYNPAKRKARGVWYTPEPVVNFIVRAVDDVSFAIAKGEQANPAAVDLTAYPKEAREIIEIGERLKAHKIRVKDLIKGRNPRPVDDPRT